jgi:hypothetical protein
MKDRSSVVSRLKLRSVVAVFALSLMGGRGAYGVTEVKCPTYCAAVTTSVNYQLATSPSVKSRTKSSEFIQVIGKFGQACLEWCRLVTVETVKNAPVVASPGPTPSTRSDERPEPSPGYSAVPLS